MSLRLGLFLILFSTESFSQTNHLLLMGGGGEPAGEKTIFDPEITELQKFFGGNQNWTKTVSFNGGHSKTEEIVARISPGNTPFTSERYEALIKDYENKINSGQIKAGDQLLIQIDTHGAMNTPREKSHSLSTAEGEIKDFATGAGSKLVSLDRLQNLINLAASKNVKLAVLDFSCHSGNALALANPNTCIISSSGTKHFGYAGPSTFSTQFAGSLKPGKSLEDVFLEALSKKTDPSFPMISTSTGREIQSEMYEGIAPFLYQWNPESHKDKLQAFIEKDVIENQCKELPQFADIMGFIAETESVLSAGRQNKDFREAVQSYYQFQMKMKEDLNALNISQINIQHKFCTTASYTLGKGGKISQERCMYKKTDEILTMDFQSARTILQEQAKAHSNVIDDAFLVADLENLKKVEAKLGELKAQDVDVEKYKNYYKSFENLEKTTYSMASAVAKEAAKVYTELYKKRSGTASNPCKNFIL